MAEMIANKSHEPQPLPAFDVRDRLIMPAKYEKKLKGAIVRVKATICHQYMGKSNNYYADIQELVVISTPVSSGVSSTLKRKMLDALEKARRPTHEDDEEKSVKRMKRT